MVMRRAVVGLALAMLATGCSSDDREVEAAIEECLRWTSNTTEAERYIGMSEAEAERAAEADGWVLRVVGRDTRCVLPRTDDAQPDRVNLWLDGSDEVVWAQRF